MAGRISRTCLTAALAAAMLAGAASLAGRDAGGSPRAHGQGLDAGAAQSQRLALRRIGSFASPVHVAHAPRRPRLLYVVEQRGTIRVMRRGSLLRRPFLDLRGRVRHAGEAGLLSVAFHPRFPRNRQFYVYYVDDEDGDIQVDRLRSRRGNPARAAPGSRRTVITIPHSRGNHFGGQLQLGPGGLLFLGTGDGGGAGDPDRTAQDRSSLLGKLLRIRPRPRGGHRSPRTNPFVGGAGRNQILSLGLRNPWRFSFDRRTGDLWIADVGQGRWEEVNHVTRDEARGANFGWSCREGPEAFAGAAPACGGIDPSALTEPVHAYPIFRGPECAIAGGHVVRGRGPAPLRGRYVYGDFCSGEIRSLDAGAADPSATDAAAGLPRVPRLTSFGEGRRGWVYVASQNGPVHRIVGR